mgnify:CR=1 FL=1
MFMHTSSLFRVRRHLTSPGRAQRLMFASTLALMLLPAGCTATGNGPASGQDAFLSPAQLSPQQPSQRAELIFAQLKLDSALGRNDREGIIDSANRLLEYSTGAYKLPSSAPIIDAAVWLLAHDHEADAVPLIRQASTRLPDDLSLVSLQADLLIQNNKRDEAIGLLRNFARSHPSDGQAQAELALALLRSAQAKEAMKVFRHIPEKQLTPQIRFAYAQALNVSGSFADARRQLETAVREDPEYAEAWQLLALTQEELDNRKEAEKIYRNLLENDPDNRSARLFLLRLLLQDNRLDEAVSMVSATQDPLHFAVAAAAMLMDEKRLDQAEKLLSRLEKQEGMPDGLYFYHAALLYESDTDIERALSYLDRVSPESSEYDKALRMKVRVLYEQKRFPEALQALDALRRLHAQEPFYSLQDGKLVLVRSRTYTFDAGLPKPYLRIMRDTINRMAQRYNEGQAVEFAAGMWAAYILYLDGHYPKIRNEKAWVLALDGFYRERNGKSVDWRALADEAGTTLRTMQMRRGKLMEAEYQIRMEEGQKGEEET